MINKLAPHKFGKFWTFVQNNSGGKFVFDKRRGIGHYVIVEADTRNSANDVAEKIGLYFDGAGDCPCCGDRWSEQCSWDKGNSEPTIYDTPAVEYKPEFTTWENEGVFIHYSNGTVDHIDFSSGNIQDDSRAKILRKIKSLLALAKDQAGKPEGITAESHAKTICKNHNIDFDSVNGEL